MKTLISTLLLTIVVFLNFSELNGESRPKRKRHHEPVDCPETQGEPHETIKYKDSIGFTYIDLWLDSTRTNVLRADFEGNYDPPSAYYKKNTFCIRLIYVRRWTVVGYFRPNGKLFGVRAPNPNARLRTLEPNPATWFIIYSSHKFMVAENPQTAHVQGVTLWPYNLHEDPENCNRVTPEKVTLSGVSFIIYRAPNNKILGAHLNPDFHTP